MEAKGPKLLLSKFMNSKTKTNEVKVEEDIQPLTQESKKTEYSILVNEFKDYYTKLTNDNNSKIKIEYKKLSNDAMEKKTAQSHVTNMATNLSNLQLPYHNQLIQVDNVKISITRSSFSNNKLDAVFLSNANNIKKTEYIVSQDPTPDSIIDFLQMIWEHNISFIIFLRRVNKRKDNIFEYWPNKEQFTNFESRDCTFRISSKNEIIMDNLTERTLSIVKNSTDVRKVLQFNLTTYTSSKEPILKTYEKLFQKTYETKTLNINCYPILFHSSNSNLDQCSVMICIDKIITSLVSGAQEINIYNTMLELSQYRNLMIQQEEEYFFIYNYIHSYLQKAIKIQQIKRKSKWPDPLVK